MKPKILIPTDFTEISQYALKYAIYMSWYLDGELTALHLVDHKKYKSKPEYQREMADLIEGKLQDELNQAKSVNPDLKKIHVQIKPLKNHVPKEIENFAKEGVYDFIVMGSQGLSPHDDWLERFHGTNAYQVLHSAPCPVFTFVDPEREVQIKKILVPLDLTAGTRQKIPLVAKLAQAFKATVYLLSIYPSSFDESWTQLEQQIKEITGELTEAGVKVRSVMYEKDDFPGEVLTYSQEIEADLIAIMTRPSTQWNELFVTPGAKRIIAHSHIPVLGVRPISKEDIGL